MNVQLDSTRDRLAEGNQPCSPLSKANQVQRMFGALIKDNRDSTATVNTVNITRAIASKGLVLIRLSNYVLVAKYL